MTDREPKKKLVGPWHSLHIAIWLIGIYILWTRSWWWPGILILVAISALYEGFLQRYVPGAYSEEKESKPAEPEQLSPSQAAAPTPIMAPAAIIQEHRLDLLPQICPSCGGPIRGHEVRWTGPQSANCPYCGTNLPMNKA